MLPLDERYDYHNLERLVAETRPHLDGIMFVLYCPVTEREVEVAWPHVPRNQGEMDQALAEVFGSVEHHFFWDGGRWVWWDANDRVVEFEKVFLSQEFDNFDRRILLARTLYGVLCADQVVTPEEQALFSRLCPELSDFSSLEEVPFEELEELPRPVGHILYALCCAMAWCDFEAAPAELELLEDIAEALHLTTLKSWELQESARHYLVDQRLGPAPHEKKHLLSVIEQARGLPMIPATVLQLAERRKLREAHSVEPAEPQGSTTEALSDWMLGHLDNWNLNQ